MKVLDHGYVRLAKQNGTELDIVNAARLSYDNKSEKLTDKDIRLLNFLVKHEHTSPLRHVGLSIEFNAPLIVARQHWRHIVGASTLEEGTPFSELSRRYVRGEVQLYTPEVWRTAPDNSKQGSGAAASEEVQQVSHAALAAVYETCLNTYEQMIEMGVAPEQARLALPAYAMYTKYLWSPSLQAAVDFVRLREATDAQSEIQEYANEVKRIIRGTFPNIAKAYFG